MVNNVRTEKQMPELEFTEKSITSLVQELMDEDTLIVTDLYGYQTLNQYGRTALVRNNHIDNIEKIIEDNNYSRVLAIGGCTALDVGRACAVGKEVITIPTILSTSCISVDRSVIRYQEGSRLEKTIAPIKTIVSIPSISESYISDLEKWSQSGFGDLFANISASIDLQYKAGNFSYEAVKDNVLECFEALDWVIESFTGYDNFCLTKLANYLHNSSLIVIERGDTELSAAGEHKLYHRMIEQQPQYIEDKPTHGQLVAVGTLIAGKIFAEQTGDNSLYEKLESTYEKLGLPLDYVGLNKIGIERKHLVQGLSSITNSKTHLGDYFAKNDYSILYRIFGGENYERV
jgi:glycerol dehydrogenase-like iron-containing ADH family enzyme